MSEYTEYLRNNLAEDGVPATSTIGTMPTTSMPLGDNLSTNGKNYKEVNKKKTLQTLRNKIK